MDSPETSQLEPEKPNTSESSTIPKFLNYAKGYAGKNGPVTMDEFKGVQGEFDKKLKTRVMTKLGFWSDFDKRRKLDKYFLKKGYEVYRRR